MKWLLRLYPPAWQRRYRTEVAHHLECEAAGIRTALDLAAGAVDAWLNQDSIPETATGGERMKITASRHGPIDIPVPDALRGAAWAIGLTLLLVAVGVVLDGALGKNIFVEALLYSAFFIAFTVSARHTYLKPYSRAARNYIIGFGVPAWYLLFLGVAALRAIG